MKKKVIHNFINIFFPLTTTMSYLFYLLAFSNPRLMLCFCAGLGIVLDFMYTGRLNLTSETVDSVLAVAGFLQMQAVTVSCRVFKSPQKTGADSVHTGM